jgi:hypothetical protein
MRVAEFDPQLSDTVTLPGGYKVSLKPRKNPLDSYLQDVPLQTPPVGGDQPVRQLAEEPATDTTTPRPLPVDMASMPSAGGKSLWQLAREPEATRRRTLAEDMGPTDYSRTPAAATARRAVPLPSLATDMGASDARLQALQDRYNQVGQENWKGRLARAVATFAPVALAGALGGTYAASGAAQGAAEAGDIRRQQEMAQRQSLEQQMESERQRQERMAERQLTYNSTLQSIQQRAQAAEERATSAKEVADIRAETQRQIGELTNQYHQGVLDVRNRGLDVQLTQHGLKTDDQGNIIEDPTSSVYQDRQALKELRAAQKDHAEAQAEAAAALNDPTSPRFKQAQQRLAVATNRLSLSEQQFEMRARGTNQGQALPGAMLDPSGNVVGTAFQQNIRPTGQERNKADMARSAKEQLSDIRDILTRRKDIFGPIKGRTTDFQVWLGSQDPDAQRFRAARTIAGDHLAGTFGGRSEAALEALDSAIGRFKDNPAAALAGVDQLIKANDRFIQAGTVSTAKPTLRNNMVPTIKTKAEYDALPSGTTYMEDGKKYRKP